MTVAMIAWRNLPASARSKITELLKNHPAYSDWRVGSLPQVEAEAYRFCQAATWPDAIRDPSNPFHRENKPPDHYVDLPHSVNGYPIPPGHSKEEVLKSENILRRMQNCVDGLKSDAVSPAEKAKLLCWLLHLWGDVHQPLHCATQFSARFPKGDKGGNLVLVARAATRVPRPANPREPLRLPRLHTFWDEVLGPDDDLKEAGESGLKSNFERVQSAAALCGATTREDLRDRLAKKDPLAWVEDGFEKAVVDAYVDDHLEYVTEDEWKADPALLIPGLPEEYQKKAKELGQRRIALAGYRLADALEILFTP
jgi:hypothetical protein